MATITIDEVYTLGKSIPHTATDYEVYMDSSMTEDKLLYRKLHDTDNLLETHVLLRYPNGSIYEPSDGTYVRCRLWYGDVPSKWYVIKDQDCPNRPILEEEGLLHKQYLTGNDISTYESSPNITQISTRKEI